MGDHYGGHDIEDDERRQRAVGPDHVSITKKEFAVLKMRQGGEHAAVCDLKNTDGDRFATVCDLSEVTIAATEKETKDMAWWDHEELKSREARSDRYKVAFPEEYSAKDVAEAAERLAAEARTAQKEIEKSAPPDLADDELNIYHGLGDCLKAFLSLPELTADRVGRFEDGIRLLQDQVLARPFRRVIRDD